MGFTSKEREGMGRGEGGEKGRRRKG